MLDAMPAGAGCLTAIRLRCSRMTPSPGKADAGLGFTAGSRTRRMRRQQRRSSETVDFSVCRPAPPQAKRLRGAQDVPKPPEPRTQDPYRNPYRRPYSTAPVYRF